MKIFSILIPVAMLLFACSGQNESSSKAKTFDPANLQTIEIAVYGMTCSGCENTVKTALEKLPGVQTAIASHTDSTTVVTFDKTKTGFEAMEVAIEGRGYSVHGFKSVEESE
jgi:copper chaperone CopZ